MTFRTGPLLNENIKVWKDEYKLIGGDSLADRIGAAIEQASFLCVVISKSSVASRLVANEIERGVLRGNRTEKLRIIPLLVDDTPLPAVLDDTVAIDFRDFAGGFEKLRTG